MTKLLFSPVGNSDPATSKGWGPLAVICADEQPEKVVLWMTKDMRENEELDKRYTSAIRHILPGAELELLMYEGLPTDTDKLFVEFKMQLAKLHAQDPDAEILLNVTSGTPAISSALVFIDSLRQFNTVPVRVTTPSTSSPILNAYNHTEFFENAEPSNREGRTNRVEHDNMISQVQVQQVVTLLEAYDFEAALIMAKESIPTYDAKYRAVELLEGAVSRLKLQPQKTEKSTLEEYIQMLKVKLLRGQFVEFTVLLTAAFTASLWLILRRSGVQDAQWSKVRPIRDSGKSAPHLDNTKISKEEQMIIALSKVVRTETFEGVIYDSHLLAMTESFCNDTDKLMQIRKVNEYLKRDNLRNEIAHNIHGVQIEEQVAWDAFDSLCAAIEIHADLYESLAKEIKTVLREVQ
ncbi:MAG: hypothetical protein LBQ41_03285 [Candidatus Ancillula sp.]|jgi:CRISPR type III-A/MTUBE-associated protein Csm6|nr:hypothetical protein [Candidatus Ancillula sp.]